MNLETKQLRKLIIIILLIALFIIVGAVMWGQMQGEVGSEIAGIAEFMGLNK